MAEKNYAARIAAILDEYQGNKARQEAPRMFEQVQGQAEEAKLFGLTPPEEPKAPKPGLLSRIFDVIQRPAFAVAEGTRRVFDPQGDSGLGDIGAFLSGAGSGISGKQKTTFSDVLGEHGVEGPLKTIGGLGLDIALDPTTYLTGGTAGGAKAIGKATLSKAGLAASKESIEKGSAKLVAKMAQKKIKQEVDSLANITYGAGKLTKAEAKAKSKFIADEFENRIAQEMSTEAQKVSSQFKQGLLLHDPKRFQVKFMGKEIASSKRLGEFGEKIGQKVLERSKSAQALNKMFRTTARFGNDPELRNIYQEVAGRGFTDWDNMMNELAPTFARVGKGERKAISHAIEKGPGSVEWQKLSPDAQKLAGEIQSSFKHMFEREKMLGLHKDEDFIENYVYHVYQNKDLAEELAGKNIAYKAKVGGTETPGFTKDRLVASLEEAKAIHGLDPVEDIADIFARRAAKHHEVTTRASFVNEVASQFGVTAGTKRTAKALEKSGYVSAKDKSKFLPDNMFFDKEVANVIGSMERLSASSPEAKHFLKMFDKVQGRYKFLVTAPNPGFHIRNLIGDTWLNYLDGVVNPKRYGQAAKVLSEFGITGGHTPAGKVGAGLLKGFAGGTGAVLGGPGKFKMRVGKAEFDATNMHNLFTQNGLRGGVITAEAGSQGIAPRTFAGTRATGAAGQALRNVSEYREDFARMAHFIDALKSESKLFAKKHGMKVDDIPKDIVETQIARMAAQRVRKFNFDYQDLTEFEKKVMRRTVPFYTFLRKNAPLQFEMLATKPGRISVVPKAHRAVEQLLGTQMVDPENPYPGLSLVAPQWLREMAPVRLKDEGMTTTYLSPELPFRDVARFAEGIHKVVTGQAGVMEGARETGQEVLSNLSPLIQMPFEIATGTAIFGGRPIKDKSMGQYLLEKLPQSRVAEALADTEGSEVSRSRIRNYLTGLGIYEIGPSQKMGELRRMQDPIQSAMSERKRQIAEPFGMEPSEFFVQRGPTTPENESRRMSAFEAGRSGKTRMKAFDTYKRLYERGIVR